MQLFSAAPSVRIFYKAGLTCEELGFAYRPRGAREEGPHLTGAEVSKGGSGGPPLPGGDGG